MPLGIVIRKSPGVTPLGEMELACGGGFARGGTGGLARVAP